MSDYFNDSTKINKIPIIRVGEVISVIDKSKSGRIKVRINGIDTEGDNGLIDCVPLLPKYLLTLPKVGECVFIFQYDYTPSSPNATFKNTRFWIGPLITQPTNLNEEPYNSALSILPDGYTKLFDQDIEEGSYGKDEDIVLQGRYNTDIIQKDREMWLRVGKTIEGSPTKFNSKNLGYVQLKYGNEKLRRVIEETIVETKIIPIPDTLTEVTINTILNNGEILSGDLPSDRYRENDVNRTELFIRVINLKNNTTITGLEREGNTAFIGPQSRDLALNVTSTFVTANRGIKWKIKSTAKDYLNTLPNVSENIAVFSSTPIPGPPKKIKNIKLEKNKGKQSSVINVVANKINLLSHDGEHTFNLTDPNNLITDQEQERINNSAHPLVYGDKLVEFLELVKKYVLSHVHPYHGLPSDPSSVTTNVIRFDLNTILNKNINSN